MKFSNSALISFLKDIYNNTNVSLLNNEEIKAIEDFYNINYDKYNNIKEFYSLDKKITKNIKKVKSVKAEIERQFSIKKKLQVGTLCECVMAETIASLYNLNCFCDVFHTYIRDLPANILYRLRDDNNRILCRYIYYNKDDLNTFIIQYGNPTRYDTDLYLNNKKVKLEFKDRISRAGEKEVEYDEKGKLFYSNEFAMESPEYIPLIKLFNEHYNIVDLTGNYKIKSEDDRIAILRSYFDNLGFEALVTIDNNSSLIAITKDCIKPDNNLKIISLEGSEIRRAGKNSYNVFTMDLLLKSIKKIDGVVESNTVKIPVNKMTDRINNGKVTGKKINHLFFVKIGKIKEKDGYYTFSLSDVKQLKPTICVHMQIISSKKELITYYEEMLNHD